MQQHANMDRLTKYDLRTIQTLLEEKRWKGNVISQQYKSKNWDVHSLNNAIKQFQNTESTYRKKRSKQMKIKL